MEDKYLSQFYDRHSSIKSVIIPRIINYTRTISYLTLNSNIRKCAFYINDSNIVNIGDVIECINMSNLIKLHFIFAMVESYIATIDILNKISHTQLRKISIRCVNSDDCECDYEPIASVLSAHKKMKTFKINGIFFYNYIRCLIKYLPDNQTLSKISAETRENITNINLNQLFSSNHTIKYIYVSKNRQIFCDGIFRNRNYEQQKIFKRTKAIVAESVHII
jgi:hypothetical protein